MHPTLVDSDHQTRHGWIETLTEIQALKPEIVVSAHRLYLKVLSEHLTELMPVVDTPTSCCANRKLFGVT